MSIWPETEGMLLRYKIREWYYWVKSWFKGPHNIIFLNIPPTWCDKDVLMRLVVFKLLVDYVEKERAVTRIVWDSCQEDIDDFNKILKAYKWIKIERDIAVKVYEDELERVYGHKSYRDPTPAEDMKKVRDAEMYYENKDQDILHDIIAVRRKLWT